MEAQVSEKFEQWCIIEIMGHQTFAGFVTERALGGTAMIQVDVPEVDAEHPAFTKLFSANAIYAISPTTEEHARAAAARIRQRPVTLYILPDAPRQLSAKTMSEEDIEGYRHADAMEDDRGDFDDDDDGDSEDDEEDDEGSPF